jgi:hypothetical protein
MALLQLAEGMNYLAEDTNPMKDYIFVPAGMFGVTEDTYVRQDFFDGLDEKEFEAVISSLAPFQNTGISDGAVEFAVGLLPGGAVASKGIAIAKGLIANRKKRVANGTANPILKGKSGSLIGKVKSAVEKITGKADQKKSLPAVDVSGSVGGTTFDLTTGGTPTTETWWSKQNKETKIGIVIGGLGVLFLGYKVISKKK